MYKNAEIDYYSMTALQLLILTGCRETEILSLKNEYLRLDKGIAILPETKTEKDRIIYFNDKSIEIIKKLQEYSNGFDYLFPSLRRKSGYIPSVWKQFKKVLYFAGFGEIKKSKANKKIYGGKFRVHDLRHAFCSIFLANGGNVHTLMKLVGHRRYETTMRYTHIGDEIREKLEQFAPNINVSTD